MPPHSRPRSVFLGQALPQDDVLFLRAAVKFQPCPFALQLFPQSLFDTAWLRGMRLPAGPWPKGSVQPLHPPETAQGQFWVAGPKDPVQHMHCMSGARPSQHVARPSTSLQHVPCIRSGCSPCAMLMLRASTPRSALCCSSTSCRPLVIRTLPSWLPESMELPKHPQPLRWTLRLDTFNITLTELQQGWLDGPGRAKHFRHQPAFLCFAVWHMQAIDALRSLF